MSGVAQAINDIFAKVTRKDVDERHLLRLGGGAKDLQEELQLDKDFSKHGRVNFMLERRSLVPHPCVHLSVLHCYWYGLVASGPCACHCSRRFALGRWVGGWVGGSEVQKKVGLRKISLKFPTHLMDLYFLPGEQFFVVDGSVVQWVGDGLVSFPQFAPHVLGKQSSVCS